MAGTKISDATTTTPVATDMIPFERVADATARHTTSAALGDLIGQTLNLGTMTEKTLDSNTNGVIDTAGLSSIRIDTFEDAATGDLETINGGTEGDILVIRADSGARTIVLKHDVDNIYLRDEGDVTLDTKELYVMLFYGPDSKWHQIL